MVALILLGVSCRPDPVHEHDVTKLGNEAAGVPTGPLHRPGQPCGTCHGTQGPAESRFALGGTIYRDPNSASALGGATVRIIDWTGAQYSATTNCAGNFFIRDSDFVPSWPVWVKIEYSGKTAEMISADFRETSCNACHADPAGPSAVGHAYFSEQDAGAPAGSCP